MSEIFDKIMAGLLFTLGTLLIVEGVLKIVSLFLSDDEEEEE